MNSIDLWFYGFCLVLGMVMSIPSAIGRTGHVGHGHAPRLHAKAGHAPRLHAKAGHATHGHHAGQHHASNAHTSQSQDVSFFNPIVFATFIGGLGAFGLILRGVGINRWLALGMAVVGGFGLAWLMFRVFIRVVLASEGGDAPEREIAVGKIARVTVAIPAHGFGAISTEINGKLQSLSARSEGSETFNKGAEVLIIGLEKTTAVVQGWEEHRA